MTSSDFGRILTLLRKEKGLSQKAAAAELGVSQALLSHYERGIRECGLDFVIRVADLYNVSCDYLLGRSPERSGSVLKEEDIPEPDAGSTDKLYKGSLLPTLNKKLVANSLNVVYGMLSRVSSTELTESVSSYLDLAVYNVYRQIYSINPSNPPDAFGIDAAAFEGKVRAAMAMEEMKMKVIATGKGLDNTGGVKDIDAASVTPEQLYRDYPLFAGSLMNLIRNAEEDIKDTLGKK